MFNVDQFVIPLVASGMTYQEYKQKPSLSPVHALLHSKKLTEVFQGYLIELAIAEVFRLHGRGGDTKIDDPFHHGFNEDGVSFCGKALDLSSRLYSSRLFSYILATFIRFSRVGIYIEFTYRAEEIATIMLFGQFESAMILDEMKAYYTQLYKEDADIAFNTGVQFPNFKLTDFDADGFYIGEDEHLRPSPHSNDALETDLQEPLPVSPVASLGLLYFYFRSLHHYKKPFDSDYYRKALLFLLKGTDLCIDDPALIAILKQRAALAFQEAGLSRVRIIADECFGATVGFNTLDDVPIDILLNFHYSGERYEQERVQRPIPMTPEDHRQISLAAAKMDDAATHLPPKYARPS